MTGEEGATHSSALCLPRSCAHRLHNDSEVVEVGTASPSSPFDTCKAQEYWEHSWPVALGTVFSHREGGDGRGLVTCETVFLPNKVPPSGPGLTGHRHGPQMHCMLREKRETSEARLPTPPRSSGYWSSMAPWGGGDRKAGRKAGGRVRKVCVLGSPPGSGQHLRVGQGPGNRSSF